MKIMQRFSLMMKGQMTGVLDALEDPERSLYQLILDMEEHLEDAKRGAARAMANEDRLRSRIEAGRREASKWEAAARRAVEKGRDEEARDALRRSERSRLQVASLEERLEAQERDTRQICDAVERLNERLEEARTQQMRLQARRRQGEARRAIGKAMRGIDRIDLESELERLEDRVELEVCEEAAYLEIDDRLRGRDVRRQRDEEALEASVDERLASLRQTVTAEGEVGRRAES